ncbi:hypothetical protein LXL04_009860 [Taraxacum kok-saghyz]
MVDTFEIGDNRVDAAGIANTELEAANRYWGRRCKYKLVFLVIKKNPAVIVHRLGHCSSARTRVGHGVAEEGGRWPRMSEKNGSRPASVRELPSRHFIEHVVCVGCVRGKLIAIWDCRTWPSATRREGPNIHVDATLNVTQIGDGKQVYKDVDLDGIREDWAHYVIKVGLGNDGIVSDKEQFGGGDVAGGKEGNKNHYYQHVVLLQATKTITINNSGTLPEGINNATNIASSSTHSTPKPKQVLKTKGGCRLKQSITTPHILPQVKSCTYCGAVKFYSEASNFCCLEGQIVLSNNELPLIMQDLMEPIAIEVAQKEYVAQQSIATSINTLTCVAYVQSHVTWHQRKRTTRYDVINAYKVPQSRKSSSFNSAYMARVKDFQSVSFPPFATLPPVQKSFLLGDDDSTIVATVAGQTHTTTFGILFELSYKPP